MEKQDESKGTDERKEQLELLAYINVGLAKELNDQQVHRINDVELLALRITELEKTLAAQEKESQAKIAFLERRNVELEDIVKSRELEVSTVKRRNAELEEELKRKEAMRLSQLAGLAIRNVQLEKEVVRCSSGDSL